MSRNLKYQNRPTQKVEEVAIRLIVLEINKRKTKEKKITLKFLKKGFFLKHLNANFFDFFLTFCLELSLHFHGY